MTPNDPQPHEKGDPQSPLGRDGEQTSDGAAGGVATSHCLRKAGVVIHASVEHVGLVGDAELTVSVKWPASTFCVQPCGKPAPPYVQAPGSQQVPGNGPQASNFDTLYGEATADPGPEVRTLTSGTATPATSGTGTPATPATSRTRTRATSGSKAK
jgi:hypothetical protein